MEEKIKLDIYRSFSDMLQVVFTFVFKKFKFLFKPQFVLSFPILLVGLGLFMYGYTSLFQSLNYYGQPTLSASFFVGVFSGIIIMLIGGVAIILLFFAQMKLYVDGIETNALKDLFPVMKPYIARTIGTIILMVVIGLSGYGVVVLITVALVAVSPILFIIVFFLIILYLLSVAVFFHAILPALFFEDLSTWKAIKRGMSIGAKSFWTFAGVGTILSMSVGTATSLLSYIIMIPFILISFALAGSNPDPANIMGYTFLIMVLPMTLFSLIQGVFYQVTSTVLYFSSVEKNEGVGLSKKINSINPEE